MKALEFEPRLEGADRIGIPSEVAQQLPTDSHLRVIVMWGDDDGEDAWHKLAMEGLSSAYAPEDSIYEELANEPPVR
jgi:hypothetical protein